MLSWILPQSGLLGQKVGPDCQNHENDDKLLNKRMRQMESIETMYGIGSWNPTKTARIPREGIRKLVCGLSRQSVSIEIDDYLVRMRVRGKHENAELSVDLELWSQIKDIDITECPFCYVECASNSEIEIKAANFIKTLMTEEAPKSLSFCSLLHSLIEQCSMLCQCDDEEEIVRVLQILEREHQDPAHSTCTLSVTCETVEGLQEFMKEDDDDEVCCPDSDGDMADEQQEFLKEDDDDENSPDSYGFCAEIAARPKEIENRMRQELEEVTAKFSYAGYDALAPKIGRYDLVLDLKEIEPIKRPEVAKAWGIDLELPLRVRFTGMFPPSIVNSTDPTTIAVRVFQGNDYGDGVGLNNAVSTSCQGAACGKKEPASLKGLCGECAVNGTPRKECKICKVEDPAQKKFSIASQLERILTSYLHQKRGRRFETTQRDLLWQLADNVDSTASQDANEMLAAELIKSDMAAFTETSGAQDAGGTKVAEVLVWAEALGLGERVDEDIIISVLTASGNQLHLTKARLLELFCPEKNVVLAPSSLRDRPEPLASSSDITAEENVSKSITDERKRQACEWVSCPSVQGNEALAVMGFLDMRLRDLWRYCVICDARHSGSRGMRPMVCGSSLCRFQFTQMGLGGECTDRVDTWAEVVDLLVSFALAAARSTRRDVVFNPFPQIEDPMSATTASSNNSPPKSVKLALDPDKPNWKALIAALERIPSVDQLLDATGDGAGSIKEYMDVRDPSRLAYPLTMWIIGSNRARLSMLMTHEHLKGISTPFQYAIESESVSKEAAFAAACMQAGGESFFAWHGSPPENWHSIIRSGLKVMSNKKGFMINGAAYGTGVYLARDSSFSWSYAARCGSELQPAATSDKTGKNRFINSSALYCLGLCQVAGTPQLHIANGSSGIYVVKDEAQVALRYLFIFPLDGNTQPPNLDASNPTLTAQLESLQLQYKLGQ